MRTAPTWFLMRAWQSTMQPIITPSAKEVMLPAPEAGSEEGECWLCGTPTKHGHPRKKVIKPTFTDGPLAKAPHSEVVCEACTWAIADRCLRNYSLFATEHSLSFPSRTQARDILLNPPSSRFMLVLAVSGQKWLHFKAPISPGGYPMYVALEEAPVVVPESFRGLLETVEELYNGGFTKAEIGSGQYQSHRIQAFGIAAWERLEEQLRPARGSRLLDLALFVARRQDEE